MVDAQGFLAMCYSFGVVAVVAVAVYALTKGYLLRKKNTNSEAFVTARGQVSYCNRT